MNLHGLLASLALFGVVVGSSACGSETVGEGALDAPDASLVTSESGNAPEDERPAAGNSGAPDAATAAPLPEPTDDAGIDAGPQLGACQGSCASADEPSCAAHCVDACASGRCTMAPFDFVSVVQVSCATTSDGRTTVTFRNAAKLRRCFGPF